tara:strand:+ start:438 stop:590 length:153 start_codon:yes stop_codon:yes gene_type:complete
MMNTWEENGSVNIDEMYLYLFIKLTEFMRWVNLPQEQWIWLDNNLFAGAL